MSMNRNITKDTVFYFRHTLYCDAYYQKVVNFLRPESEGRGSQPFFWILKLQQLGCTTCGKRVSSILCYASLSPATHRLGTDRMFFMCRRASVHTFWRHPAAHENPDAHLRKFSSTGIVCVFFACVFRLHLPQTIKSITSTLKQAHLAECTFTAKLMSRWCECT